MSKPNTILFKKLILPITSSIIALSLVGSSEITKAQESDLIWLNAFGGTGDDNFSGVDETNDGGFILVGETSSSNGDYTSNKGLKDLALVKLDASGNKDWVKTYGGTDTDSLYDVKQTMDEGYIAVGTSRSNNGDIPGNKGVGDFIIAKFDKNGDREWIKNYGGSNTDNFYSVLELSDGDYIAVGQSASNNGDITSPKGSYDGIVARFDKNGNKRWIKNYGGSKVEYFNSAGLTKDGNLILSGASDSLNGDLIGNRGLSDIILAKVDLNGNLLWQKSYGGSKNDYLEHIFETSDGGFIGSGYTESTNGDIGASKGQYDGFLMKFDNNGNKIWLQKIGGSNIDALYNAFETLDGEYIASGMSMSSNGDINENKGSSDIMVVKLDSSGNKKWVKTIGGSGAEQPSSSLLTADDNYFLTGLTNSSELAKHGLLDSFTLKIEGDKTPPGEITNWEEAHTSNSIDLKWNNPTNDDFSHINIYRDGILIKTSSSNTYSDGLLNDGTEYVYKITTVDRLNNESLGSTITVKTDDVTAPRLPTNFNGKGEDGAIQLWWDPNTEPDLAGYNIYIDGVKKNDQLITETKYEITGFTDDQTYHVSISAVDTSNNESTLTGPLAIRVMDTIAPGLPVNFNGKGQNGTIQLWWEPNSELDLAGYNIYIDGVKKNAQLITATNYDISGFTDDQTYHVSISAVDKSSNESPLTEAKGIRVKDTIAPSKPNITSAIFDPSTGHLTVSFERNIEEDFYGFNIYVNDVLFNSEILTDLNVKLNLLPGIYKVFAIALDKFMNESISSPIMEVIVNEIKDDGNENVDPSPEEPEEPGEEVSETPNNPNPGAIPPSSEESKPTPSTKKPKPSLDASNNPGGKTPSINPKSKNINSKNEKNIIDETDQDTAEGNKQTQKEESESKNTGKKTEGNEKEKQGKPEEKEFTIKEFIEKNILVVSIMGLLFGFLLVHILIKKKLR